MGDIIDLDALVPQSVTVKFNNKEIQVNPPKTVDVLRLGFYGQQIAKADSLEPAELQAAVDNLTALVQSCIPELDGELTSAQLLKLVEIISNMSVPSDAKELQKRGITPDTPKATP